ncbi:MAG: hypothetical protein OEU83_02130 [Gammaproteobacteria bacterium]|jgi:hypothetical protein|nr:hypothetical protein [Gammaproteobacteria bacterium]
MHFVAIGSPAEDTVGELIAGLGSRQIPERKQVIRSILISLTAAVLLMPSAANAFDVEEALRQLHVQHQQAPRPDLRVAKDGMTLDQAIESVRRRGDVDRILSAETRRDGDRETHYIRYLTKDGKVKTEKVRGRSRG